MTWAWLWKPLAIGCLSSVSSICWNSPSSVMFLPATRSWPSLFHCCCAFLLLLSSCLQMVYRVSGSPESTVTSCSSSSSSSPVHESGVWNQGYNESQEACPAEWLHYKGHCYKAFLQQKESYQWYEAEAKCLEAGLGRDGHLVSILDAREMGQIWQWLRTEWKATEFDAIYIGLNDVMKEGSYRWSDNNPMSYTDWAPASLTLNSKTQPDGGVFEDCTVMILDRMNDTSANWHDIPCTLSEHGQIRNKNNTTASFYSFIDSVDSYICKMDARLVANREDYNLGSGAWHQNGNKSFIFQNQLSKTREEISHVLWIKNFASTPNSHNSVGVNGQEETTVIEKQWICADLDVISVAFRCDQRSDCRDNSDEEDCPNLYLCLPSQFQCTNGRCIAISAYCDLVDDCGDGSDERLCRYPACNLTSDFRCLTGQCIPKSKRCDLIPDCGDESDELYCGSGRLCNPNSTFQCHCGTCIPNSAVCDGYRDCPGLFTEDEDSSRCQPVDRRADFLLEDRRFLFTPGLMSGNQNFICRSGHEVQSSFRCIYDFNQYSYQVGCRDMSHLVDCENFTCPVDYVKCPESYCIPHRLLCNGKWDCTGGHDEQGCVYYQCPGQYKCANSSVCTLLSHLCDGMKHCPEGDDEWLCDLTCPTGCTCIGLYVSCVSHGLLTLPPGIHLDVRKLNLSHNLLGNRMMIQEWNLTTDYSFAPYSELGELILQHNNITILPDLKFSCLRNLYLLDLRWNNILTIESNAFARLRKIQSLQLAHNGNLSFIGADAFEGLERLRNLNVSNCRLTHLSNNTFSHLQRLHHLQLQNNDIVIIEEHAFSQLTDLVSLDLRGNEIKTLSRDTIRDMRSLLHLKTDSFKFCCLVPGKVTCSPPADAISDCEDLMGNPLQRVFLWILGFGALIFNLMVIVKRLKSSFRPHGRHTDRVSSSLVISLAFADLLMGIYLIIIASVDVYYRGRYIEVSDTWLSSSLCKLCGFISTLSSEASVFTLVIITLDRLICIHFPFRAYKFSMRTTYKLIGVTWATAFIMSFLPLIVRPYFRDEFYARSGVCLALHLTNTHPAGWQYSVAIFLVTNLAAFSLILIAYILMYQKVRSTRRATRVIKSSQQQEINTGKKMALIVLSNFCCWFPVILMGMIAMSGVHLPPAVYSWTAVFILPFNSALNPIIYTISHYAPADFFNLSGKSRKDSVTGAKTLNHVLSMRSTSGNFNGLNGNRNHAIKEHAVKDMSHPPPGYQCLQDFLSKTRPLTPRHLTQISCSLAHQVEVIHATNQTVGEAGISISSVFVSAKVDPNCLQVYIPDRHRSPVPSGVRSADAFGEDIHLIGNMIQAMLRIYNHAKQSNGVAETAIESENQVSRRNGRSPDRKDP